MNKKLFRFWQGTCCLSFNLRININISSFNPYGTSIDQCISNFLMSRLNDPSKCLPGNIHFFSSLFLIQAFKICQSYCFIFIQMQHYFRKHSKWNTGWLVKSNIRRQMNLSDTFISGHMLKISFHNNKHMPKTKKAYSAFLQNNDKRGFIRLRMMSWLRQLKVFR